MPRVRIRIPVNSAIETAQMYPENKNGIAKIKVIIGIARASELNRVEMLAVKGQKSANIKALHPALSFDTLKIANAPKQIEKSSKPI